MSVRVLLAEDHPALRRGIRAFLDASNEITVVGEAASGNEAIRLVAELEPDVVLMDLQMPDMNGVEATRRLTTDAPNVRVLVLTMFDDDDTVFTAIRAGARGYLLKGAEEDEILRAVRAVAAGEAIFGPAIAERMIGYFASAEASTFPQLTTRERVVLELLAAGKSNQAIAQDLVLSLKTVRNHVSNIFNKLHVPDRAAAIVKAREAGMGRNEPLRKADSGNRS